jgi:two-component system, chemotaxis family, chemotaxis protein CheY
VGFVGSVGNPKFAVLRKKPDDLFVLAGDPFAFVFRNFFAAFLRTPAGIGSQYADMSLPRHLSGSAAASQIDGEAAGRPNPLRILYAEDMPELRDVVRLSLERDGHFVACVEDGALALAQITADPKSFHVVITDHHMPKVNGLELVIQLREIGFSGKIMVFSSELSREIHHAYQRLNVDRMLFKPVFPSTLRQVVKDLHSPVAVASHK